MNVYKQKLWINLNSKKRCEDVFRCESNFCALKIKYKTYQHAFLSLLRQNFNTGCLWI